MSMINVQATTIDELVEALDPALLPKLLAATANELAETSAGWVERATEEVKAGAEEYGPVLEQSAQFHHLAMVAKLAVDTLAAYSREIGAFD